MQGQAQPGMPLLMAEQAGKPDVVTEHPAIACTPDLPFLACQLCRERMSEPPWPARSKLCMLLATAAALVSDIENCEGCD